MKHDKRMFTTANRKERVLSVDEPWKLMLNPEAVVACPHAAVPALAGGIVWAR
jgi:hypothetical protein